MNMRNISAELIASNIELTALRRIVRFQPIEEEKTRNETQTDTDSYTLSGARVSIEK